MQKKEVKSGPPDESTFVRNKVKQRKFLKALETTFNVVAAAKSVGVTTNTVYKFARNNEEFAEKMAKAREIVAARAEAEAFERGVNGTAEVREKFDGEGKLIGKEVLHRKSDRLLEVFLKGNMPHIYGNKLQADITVEDVTNSRAIKEAMIRRLEIDPDDIIDGDYEDVSRG